MMPRLSTHPDVDFLWYCADLLRRGYIIAVALAAGMLAVIWIGGDARFSSPGFATLRTLGGWPVTCALLGMLLVALLAARVAGTRLLGWALYAAGGVYLLLGVSFLISALRSPVTALTGAPAYFALAAFHVSHAIDYRHRPGGTQP